MNHADAEIMMKSSNVRLFALFALLATAACDEALVPGELTETEAAELAALVMESTFSNTAGLAQPAQANGPAMVPVEFSQSVDTSLPCPMGGSVGVSATFDYLGDSDAAGFELDYTMTQTHDGCSAASESGKQFTLNGSPNLQLDIGIFSQDGQSASWNGSITGAIDWESEGFEGSCSMTLEFGGSALSENSANFEMSGSVCGHSVQQSLSIGGSGVG